jgi:hypothetical protein
MVRFAVVVSVLVLISLLFVFFAPILTFRIGPSHPEIGIEGTESVSCYFFGFGEMHYTTVASPLGFSRSAWVFGGQCGAYPFKPLPV